MGETAEILTLEQEVKRDNRIVQGWLLQYRQRKEKYLAKLDNALYASPAPPDGMPRGSGVSNPTEQKGGRLAELGEGDGAWLALIEEVQERLPWKMQIVLKLRREAMYIKGKRRGRPAWVAYVQVHYCEEVAARTGQPLEDVWISKEHTFYAWWARILEYTARLAIKRGLVE